MERKAKQNTDPVSGGAGSSRPGTVILVGAGCGRGLITAEGLAELGRADTVVYDDLIDSDLLSAVRPGARCIYVGKRFGAHSMEQDEINALLVREAQAGRYVVRLKGGDSFVFGRGGEEYTALCVAGIPCALIPGVTSAVAVPEHAGIPVTFRQTAQSFTVVTGHSASELSENYEALAKLNGTLVFLMGLHTLPEIVEKLMRCGKAPETPAAVISKGFSAEEKRIDGTLADIARKAEHAESPALIVIGPAAALHMTDTRALPLTGIRVTAVGTASFTARLRRKLEAAGAFAEELPAIRVVPREGAVPELPGPYTWIAFTSSNGVRLFFQTLRERGTDFRALGELRFACIGGGTRETLLQYGIRADFVPSEFTAETFGRELPGAMQAAAAVAQGLRADAAASPGRLLILRAAEGSPKLPEALSRAGISYEDRKLYDSVCVRDDGSFHPPLLRRASDCRYLVFASAGGVRAVFSPDGILGGAALPETVMPVCIGRETAAALEQFTARPHLTAREHTADGIVRTILADVQRNGKLV